MEGGHYVFAAITPAQLECELRTDLPRCPSYKNPHCSLLFQESTQF